MIEKQFDFESYIKEIEEVRKRYDLEKGVGLIPDKIEIALERNGEKYKLNYKEFFINAHKEVIDFSIQNAVALLTQIGINPSSINYYENGIGYEITGDYMMIYPAVFELLIQSKYIVNNIESECAFVADYINKFSAFLDLCWEYDDSVRNRMKELIIAIIKNPELTAEFQKIQDKYSQPR